MNNAYALITGGSSGIGFEIAKDLADEDTIFFWFQEMNKISRLL